MGKDFNLYDDFDFDMDMFDDESTSRVKTKYARVKRYNAPKVAKYRNAQALISDIGTIEQGDHLDCIVSGDFIAGDLIESYLMDNNLIAKEIIISTLSLSQDNIDGLKNISDYALSGKMGLIVSDFFFSHERKVLVEYIINTLKHELFYFAVAGIHTKITLIETECGQNIVIGGSANLRSSLNIEQITIDNNKLLYDFHREWMTNIINKYQVKHEMLRRDKLWQQVAAEKAVV